MLRLLIVCCMVFAGGVVWAAEWDYGYGGKQENTRAKQEYNPMENRWETTKGKKSLKYNPMENEWSYQDRDASPTYNPMENRWEYPK